MIQFYQPFYVVSHSNYQVILHSVSGGKFHDKGYSDFLYGKNNIDMIRGCCTPEYSVTTTVHYGLREKSPSCDPISDI